ncbi:MAG: WD40 repeat domain-containing protein [Gemmataceae bacterium]|nr:WD40 repeat domain-containing protein [Gemmataceae bacterium]
MLTLSGHSGYVFGLAFHPDGTMLASASYDGTVRLWSLPDGRETARLPGPCQYAHAVDFSPDGSLLAAGYGRPRGVVQWYRLDDLTHPIRSEGHSDICRDVRFANPGILYTAGGDELLKHEVATGAVSRHVNHDFKPCQAVDFSPTGDPVALIGGRAVQLPPDLSQPRVLFRANGPQPARRLRAAGGRFAVVGGRRLFVWDGPPSATPRHWDADDRELYCVEFDPFGSLLTGGADGMVKRWNPVTGELISGYDWGIGEALSLAVSRDGTLAAAGGLSDIAVWDLE